MRSSENQSPQPLSLLFLKSIVTGMGIILVLGFTLVIAMILLGMKYFTDVRSCDAYPQGDIYLELPQNTEIQDIHVDCGIIKAKSNDKLFGFNSETGKLVFTIHKNNTPH